MSNIENGGTAVTLLAQRVLCEVIAVDSITALGPKYIGTVIEQFRVGVGSVKQQSVAEPAFDGKLPAVIDGVARIVADGHWTEVRVHASATVDPGIECLTLEQVLAARPNVGGSDDDSAW